MTKSAIVASSTKAPAADSEGDAAGPSKPKRARKSKAKAARADSDDELAAEVAELADGDADGDADEADSAVKVKKPRARKAKLSGFTNLSLDIITAVFAYAGAAELLALSRANKQFNRLLMDKAFAAPLWRAALEQEGLTVPPDMTEPRLANVGCRRVQTGR